MTFWPEASGKMLRPLKRTCSLNPDVLPESTDPELEFDYVDIGNVSLESGVTDRVHMTVSQKIGDTPCLVSVFLVLKSVFF